MALTADCRSLTSPATTAIANREEPVLPLAWLRLAETGEVIAAGGAIERIFSVPRDIIFEKSPLELIDMNPTLFASHCARAQQEGVVTFRSGRFEVDIVAGESQTTLIVRDADPVDRLTNAFSNQERLATLGRATITAAHEINNTLTAINSVIPVLEHPGLAEVERRKHITALKKEAGRAIRVVGGLVNLAREWRDDVEAIDSRELVHGALALYRRALECAKIETEINAPSEAPIVVGRRVQIENALHQLITNSIRALKNSSASARVIRVGIDRSGTNHARIVVEDTGPGIDPSIRSCIFERFVTTSPDRPGLGLWIARKLIEVNGGMIQLVSGEAGRTSFAIQLPTITSQSPKHLEAGGDRKPQFEQLQAMMGLRILIVDDNQTLRDSAARILRLYGPELVVEAASATEALEAIREGPDLFEIVLLDIRLPDSNGRDTYYEIQRIAPNLAAGVIFMVGERIEGEMLAFLQSVGAPYLGKPFQIPDLVRTVGQVASIRRAQKADENKRLPNPRPYSIKE